MEFNRVSIEILDINSRKRQINCQNAYPIHTDPRGRVHAIAEGNYEMANLIVRDPNPLASVYGRICGAPCEAACGQSDWLSHSSIVIVMIISFAILDILKQNQNIFNQNTNFELKRFKPIKFFRDR